MTWTGTVSVRLPLGGGQYLVAGSYENTGVTTGGTITTGLSVITAMNSSCGTSQAATVNKMTASAGTITVLCVASEDGTWWAVGRL
jgi:hypothetical protein